MKNGNSKNGPKGGPGNGERPKNGKLREQLVAECRAMNDRVMEIIADCETLKKDLAKFQARILKLLK